ACARTRDRHSFPTRRSSDLVRRLVLAELFRLRLPRTVDVDEYRLLVLERGGVQLLQQLVQHGDGEDVLSGVRLELQHDGRRALRSEEQRLNSSHDQISYAVF